MIIDMATFNSLPIGNFDTLSLECPSENTKQNYWEFKDLRTCNNLQELVTPIKIFWVLVGSFVWAFSELENNCKDL